MPANHVIVSGIDWYSCNHARSSDQVVAEAKPRQAPIMFKYPVPHLIILIAAVTMISSPVLASPDRWKFEGWSKTDFSRTKIDFGEILSGGPPKDGIPAIDKPTFETLNKSNALKDNVPVIGLEINGDARAYPIPVLMWHEIVNDTVGGEPVTVTYCPLCNAALVFHRKVGDQVLDFGTTGKLRNSDLVMYDRQTESWWQQFTGEAIVGRLMGTELKLLPSRLESFSDFKQRHPNGKILVPNNPAFRPYGRNPYVGYDSAARPFLYRGSMPEGIEPMARVVVVRNNGQASAISLKAVRDKKKVMLNGIQISWKAGQASALDTSDIAKGRDVGG
ncbi:MAG: DUF3179 domain-containing protein, partial [Hyphomicrobiaceae bacterium]